MTTGVYVVGLGNTDMDWNLGVSTEMLFLQAIKAALKDAGLTKQDIDGFSGRWTAPGGTAMHPGSADWSTLLGQPLSWIGDTYPQGPPGLMDAASAVSAGACTVAVVVSGQGALGDGLADYTTPHNEFVAPYGAFTAASFAWSRNATCTNSVPARARRSARTSPASPRRYATAAAKTPRLC